MIKTDGLYPTTPGYDEATGLGSPQSAAAWYSSANSFAMCKWPYACRCGISTDFG
jgi:hypothetical protein